jgi:hypothetical protein
VLPRIKIFYEDAGQEVELARDMRMEKEQVIFMRRDHKERIFKLRSRITFEPAEFYEIASACFFFSQDLVKGLPRNVVGE